MLTGSISGSARMLFVSQPAISRLLAYTEQRLGLTLFERIKGRLYPTPEARRLFVEVNAVYESVRRVNDVATDLLENRIGHLRIACSPHLGQSIVAIAIAEFYLRFPHVRIILHTMIPSVLLQSVLAHQVELGVAFFESVHPNVSAKKLYENRLIVVIPRGHRLESVSSVRMPDLVNEPMIGYGGDIPMGQLLRRLFNESGCCLNIKTEVQQAHVACALVHAGAGVAIVDELTMVGPSWGRIVAKPFEPTQSAPISVLHPVLTPLSRPASEFLVMLEWCLSKLPRDD